MQVGQTLIGTSASHAAGGRRARPAPKQCFQPDCDQPAVAKGLCSHCYNATRWREQRTRHDLPPDPDRALVDLALACVEAGWPIDLVFEQLPTIWNHWPRASEKFSFLLAD
jgi:hypothetical protein